MQAAKIMGANTENIEDVKSQAGPLLSDEIIKIMKQLNVPNGLSAIGFNSNDINSLVEGTLPQHRVTKLSPRPADAYDLENLFNDSMEIW